MGRGQCAVVSTCMPRETFSTSEEHIPAGRGRHGEHLHAGASLLGKRWPLRGTHQMQSKVIRGHQRPSEVITERERETIDGTKAPLGGAPGRRALTHRLS